MPITPIDGKTGHTKPPQDPSPDSVVPPPTWQNPTPFPDNAPPILRKTRLRKSQFPKAVQELALFIAANLSGDYVVALQEKLRKGDKDTMKHFSQIVGLLKNDSGVQVNLQTNIGIQAGGSARRVDSLVRMLDDRDRTQVIDAPVAGEDREFEEEDED